MKKVRNSILLFLVIFLIGIGVTIVTISSSLHKEDKVEETVQLQKDTAFLLKAEANVKTV